MDNNAHGCSIRMEQSARRLFGGLERYDLDGLLNSDVFDRDPYEAALHVLKMYRSEIPDEARFMTDRFILLFESRVQTIVHELPEQLNLHSRSSLADAFDSLVNNLIGMNG